MDQYTPHEVKLSVTVNGSRPAVYESFSNPAQVSRWFSTKHEADVTPGGTYRNTDGDQGRFIRVRPPEVLQFTWDNPSHCPGTVVTVTFESIAPATTVVRLHHQDLGSKSDVTDMTGGWSWALASFKSYFESGKAIKHEEWLAGR